MERTKRSPIWEIDEDLFKKSVSAANSYYDIARILKLTISGGVVKTIKKRIHQLNICTLHLPVGRDHNSKRTFNVKTYFDVTSKICSICKIDKSITEYAIKEKNRGLRTSECKACHRIIRGLYYKKNTIKERKRTKEYKAEVILKVRLYKQDLMCSVCSESHISCLHFHHTDPLEKEYNIAQMASKGKSFKSIKSEIDKCTVLCANCHCKLHYDERNCESVREV